MLVEHSTAPRRQFDILCGGSGNAGNISCNTPFGATRAAGPEGDETASSPMNVFRSMLASDHPKRVIDEVEARVGLPSVEHLPSMDRPTFIARVIAGFMENRAFSPMGWRPSCGWYDTSAAGCAVSEWVRAFPDEWRTLNAEVTPSNQYSLSRGAARFWLLSRVGVNPEPRKTVEPSAGPSMALDMVTGRASLVGIQKPPFDLWGHSQANGRRVLDAVRWVEDRVEVDR